uniref:Nodulation-signaling pathway 2 protein n=2 Tax=Cajanus cajan TaxID=3821 RepID=A0A151RPV4_CAJCA|nr:Nodulation-signaling pathway 2 protein [Cajanus cajan]
MIDDPDFLDFSDHHSATTPSSPLIDWDSLAALVLSPDPPPAEDSDSTVATSEEEEEEGLRLVHLLLAAAEALSSGTESHSLARAILVRLNELASPSHGTNMERLGAHFSHALEHLLNGAGTAHSTPLPVTDTLLAFQLLQDMSPYVNFAHFTANQAILESLAHQKRLHVVDFDVSQGAQWASLIQALSSSPGPHLRITALSRGGERKSLATVQETGRRLTAFAASVKQPFSFHHCRLDPDETFRPSSLKLVRGEALVFNCILHLPHLAFRPSASVASFLEGAKELKASLVVVVEEEVGPIGDGGFLGLFMDSLHRYSAVFDSLEVGFPMQRWARGLVERVLLGPRIVGSVGRMFRGGETEEEEEGGSWVEWLGAGGFRGVPISFANHCQANLLVGLFNDGYRVEELGNNKLVLGWKSRRLLSASLWTSHS